MNATSVTPGRPVPGIRVVLALVGSRGDVQPGLVVARELLERGHEVTLGVAPNMLDVARRLGLPAQPVGIDSAALLGSDVVRHGLHSPDPRVRLRAAREVSTRGWDELRAGLLPLAEGADLLVTGLLGQEVGSAVAQVHGSAFAALHYCPVRATGLVPWVPGLPTGAPQRWAARAGEGLRRRLTAPAEDRERAALGLPAARSGLPQRLEARGAREIQCYDPVLVPGLAREWGGRRPFTGYLALSEADRALLGEEPDPQLRDWLDAGEPPLYVGFGSMPVADPAGMVATVAQVARRTGRRVLMVSGWNDVPAAVAGNAVRVVSSVDHEDVLPRCAVAVHHGGAGTTGAALRAGVPSVVAAWSADQPVWGRLLERAGVGVATTASRLDADHLTTLVGRALDPAVGRRARELAARVVPPERAVAATVDELELSH